MKKIIFLLILIPAGLAYSFAGCSNEGGDYSETGIGIDVGTDVGPKIIGNPVQLTSGPITGEWNDGVSSFKGIPYAAPPVGELRWKPPQAPELWTEPRACVEFGPSAPQREDVDLGFVVDEMDEDCLYLNVWTPASSENERLPVLFWIHGGGFILGSGSHPNFSGQHLARNQNVVVVTINYRLGVFGFFAHPGLSAESPDNISGNYGLKDQIFALEWVRDNIRKFGGDPDNVTMFGESAGGVSVCFLMASPPARGLFHRAVAQSGGAVVNLRHLKNDTELMTSKESDGIEFAKTFGIYGIQGAVAQLREKPWEEIFDQDDMSVILPGGTTLELVCIDDTVVPDTPYNIFAAGQEAPVPFITGTTGNEGSLFSHRLPIVLVFQLEMFFDYVLGDRADEAMVLYDVNTNEDVERALNEFLSDTFIASARRTARAHAAAGHETFRYHFTRSLPWMDALGYGAFHGCEIVYVFGTLQSELGYTEIDEKISNNVMRYWTRFAGTGDPNIHWSSMLINRPMHWTRSETTGDLIGGSVYHWPVYNADDDNTLIIDSFIHMGGKLREPYCDLIDSIYE